MPDEPSRLGLRGPLLERYSAAGWIEEGRLVPGAARLLGEVARGPDPGGARGRLASIAEADASMAADLLSRPDLGEAAAALAGASRALAAVAAARPGVLRSAAAGEISPLPDIPAGSDAEGAAGSLRDGVRAALLGIAVGDLTGRLSMPEVGEALSDLADRAASQALQAAARIAGADRLPMAVIAMGKWGGRELNYASDVDVLFVYSGTDEAAADSARRTCEAFLAILGDGGTGAFRVDAGLRPEGRNGPLARTLDSYRAYWERWAETWELQALIKARPAAGDAALGGSFVEAAAPFVFPETLGADAVREVRSMKARAEEISGRDGGEIKRGVGGIRDVEFAVQLLQLVHGRTDRELRGANTLEALAVLGEGGYVRTDDAGDLSAAYAWLRDIEHRIQLYDLRQTHTLPSDPAGRERIAKVMGYRDSAGRSAVEEFDEDLVSRRTEVRTIHERLFYRPLLERYASAPASRLTEEEAARRLAALGFLDAGAARRAFADLTGGLSRRSRMMQQALPLMLDWLSGAPDPDLGLSQLRMLVTGVPDNAELVAAVRDDPVAAERLCLLLGTSRLLGRLLDRIPASLSRLGDDRRLDAFPSPADLAAEADRVVRVRGDHRARVAALRRFAQAHLVWIASADLVGRTGPEEVGGRLASVADALAGACLDIARSQVEGETPPMAVIGMGKWGGRELNYGSDLDALLVHSSAGEEATRNALRAAERFVEILGEATADGPGRGIDLDLRPEGRKGPPTRSLDSYRAYYERWAETWEMQALLRARPVAGDAGLAAGFMEAAAAVSPPPGFGDEGVRAVRAMKARIEKERIPAGEDPDFHMKLGRGGLADVEWTVQLLQLRHGGSGPRAGTLPALDHLVEAGRLDAADGEVLRRAHTFCSAVRNRLFLQAGRTRDSLPGDPTEVTRLARSLGYVQDPRASLREDYRRMTRRARRVVQRVFYGD